MDALISFAPVEGESVSLGGSFEINAMFTRDYVESEPIVEVIREEVTHYLNNTIVEVREIETTKQNNVLAFTAFGIVVLCTMIVVYVCLKY